MTEGHDLWAERALAAARTAAGIDRAEPRDFADALGAFFRFARDTSPMAAGVAQLDALVERLLVNRLRFAEDLARHPEIAAEDVSDPIVVLGFPRSGTTVLQRMMSADPANQSLRTWRLLNPAPLPGEPRDVPGGRLAYAEQVADAIRTYNPALNTAHPAVPDDADEDWYLHHLTFTHIGQIYTGVADPGYLAYLRTLPRLPGYCYVADLLRYLQWQDGGRRGRRWILKSPVHVGHVEELLAVHPRATFVYPRRDFRTVVASFCATLEASLQPNLARAPEAIGRLTLDFWVPEMRRFRETRDRLGARLKLVEIPYREFLADPVAHIRTIYAQAGAMLSETGEAAVRAWIADNPAGKHGVTDYALDRYGLTAAQVDEAFAEREPRSPNLEYDRHG